MKLGSHTNQQYDIRRVAVQSISHRQPDGDPVPVVGKAGHGRGHIVVVVVNSAEMFRVNA